MGGVRRREKGCFPLHLALSHGKGGIRPKFQRIQNYPADVPDPDNVPNSALAGSYK